MPKTLPPGTIDVGPARFDVSAVPDVFDERDLDYRPRLQPLAASVDRRLGNRDVSTQTRNSCTGHAVAAMINAVLRNHTAAVREAADEGDDGAGGRPDDDPPVRASAAMLYAMARRYDEFEGEEDAGSSLRGALKGWFYHGVLTEEDWPEGAEDVEVDLDPVLAERAMRRPLGAFYRVNPFRLDDMQSAISELYGIAASSVIHEGWQEPRQVVKDGRRMMVIERPPGATLLGGHAYAIVGYNEVGFLVQNSWGREWGRNGCATLPYDDWLESAYDAWVARPGVHTVVSSRERTKLVQDTAGGLSAGPGPDLVRLQRHVVNLGNEGLLSTSGRFRSSPRQVDLVFSRMEEYHERWQRTESDPTPRRVVLYAHGGLNSEGTGLSIAQKHLNWWLNNRVYPVTFAWQSGPVESLLDHLGDIVKDKLPFGGIGIDLVEQFDRLVERLARSQLRWMWDEMKENARAASGPAGTEITWPSGSAPDGSLAAVPGATLAAHRLATYIDSVPDRAVEVHLVGHSAGSIFLAALLQRLVESGVPVASVSFLAPAITVDAFGAEVLPHLRSGAVPRFVSFGLTDRRELDDVCAFKGRAIYQKSLLYLVSRALERPGVADGAGKPKDVAEVPLVGMERFRDAPVPGGKTLRQALAALDHADLVWAPSGRPPGSRSDADSHGDLDDDAPTMTSVLLRIVGRRGEPTARMTYAANTALLDPEDAQGGAPPGSGETAEAHDAGAAPVTRTAAPQPDGVEVPEVRQGRPPEEKVAPRSTSGVLDALLRDGWEPSDP